MRKILLLILLCGLYRGNCLAQNPPITPAWAFGHIVWEDSINTRESAERLVLAYQQHDIPVDAIIIDSPWTTSYNDFIWDETRYPQPQRMIEGFANQGIRTILWTTGNVNLKDRKGDTSIGTHAHLQEIIGKGFAINDGQIYHWWKGDGVHLDFTNQEAVRWWFKQLDKAYTKGVYGWKVDQGEFWLDSIVKTSKGIMSQVDFRPYYYNAMYDYTRMKSDEGIIIARPFSHQGGFAASVAKLNMGWCGDYSGNWKGIQNQLSDIYRSAQAGYGAIAMEVGGFYQGRSDKEQFTRYFQAGCMTACIINGGENGAFTNHLPWWFGDSVSDGYRFCVTLHRQLAPYKFSTVVDAHLHGGSLLREPSSVEWSHRVGNDIFTKVITQAGGEATFHLPTSGQWVDFWNQTVHQAGEAIHQTYPLHRFPLFIRKGSIIPLSIDNDITGIGDETCAGKRVFLITPDGRTSQTLYLPEGAGTAYFKCTVAYDEEKRTVSIQSEKEVDACVIVQHVGCVAGKGSELILTL